MPRTPCVVPEHLGSVTINPISDGHANPGQPQRRVLGERLPHIDTDRCTGCGWCVAACPPRVLSLDVVAWRKRSVLHNAIDCTGCSLCERRCPFGVITMRHTHRPASGQA